MSPARCCATSAAGGSSSDIPSAAQWHGETDAIVARQGRRAIAGGTASDCLRRRNAGSSARRAYTCSADARQFAAVLSNLRAAGLSSGASGIRAGLGDRHRSHRDAAQAQEVHRCDARADRACGRVGRSRQLTHSLWRQRQAGQCGGIVRAGRYRWRADRRRIAGRAGISGDLRCRSNVVFDSWTKGFKMAWLTTLLIVVQVICGDCHHRAGAASARQRCGHGRRVRRRCLGQPVRRHGLGEFPVAQHRRCGDGVFSGDARARVHEHRDQAARRQRDRPAVS